MKKFRSLLLSMAMLVSVCPLYGFTSAKDGDPDENNTITRDDVTEVLERTIEAVRKAKEGIGPKVISNLEEIAEEKETSALDSIDSAYERKEEAEARIAEYADLAEAARDKAIENKSDVITDSEDAGEAQKDAGWQQFIAEHTFSYPVADHAAWEAYKDAKTADTSLADALAKKDAAKKNADIAEENFEAAEAEYNAAVKDIKDALDQGLLDAKEAEAKTREAEQKALAVAEELNKAKKAADKAADEAWTAMSDARANFEAAVDALNMTINEYSMLIRMDVEDVVAARVTLEMVKAVTEKAIEICDDYAEDEEVRDEKIAELNKDLGAAEEAVLSTLEEMDDEDSMLVFKTLLSVYLALLDNHDVRDNVKIEIESQEDAEDFRDDMITWLKNDVEKASAQVKKDAKALKTASVTMVETSVAYGVKEAVYQLTAVASEEADKEAVMAIEAHSDAGEALSKVETLAKQGIEVSTEDLNRAVTASFIAGQNASTAETAYEETSDSAKAARNSAIRARWAANRLLPAAQGGRVF